MLKRAVITIELPDRGICTIHGAVSAPPLPGDDLPLTLPRRPQDAACMVARMGAWLTADGLLHGTPWELLVPQDCRWRRESEPEIGYTIRYESTWRPDISWADLWEAVCFGAWTGDPEDVPGTVRFGEQAAWSQLVRAWARSHGLMWTLRSRVAAH